MEYVRSQYRLKKSVSDWLKREADQNNRSKNGELNALLERMMNEQREGDLRNGNSAGRN